MTLPPIEKIPVWGPAGFLGWSCYVWFDPMWLEANRPAGYDQFEGYGRALIRGINMIHEDPSIRGWDSVSVPPYHPWDRFGGGHAFMWFKDFDPKHDEEPIHDL